VTTHVRREKHTGRDEAPVLWIVDDDVPTVDLVRAVAEESGWVAYDFGRIAEVRGSLGRRRPALLILDDDLPDGRGGDLARELRDDPTTADVATVVCTAANAGRRREIRGWAPVISKPFAVSEIERHLRARAPRARRASGQRVRAGSRA
jgi:DNA-binding response OmpR family regulator